MAIQVSKRKLETMKASFPVALPTRALPAPVPPPQVVDVDAIANAVKVVLYEQRVLNETALQQFGAAIAQLRIPVGWQGNWNVSITKRDSLGRISEVLFKPAKP